MPKQHTLIYIDIYVCVYMCMSASDLICSIHVQDHLGDVVYVELPDVGASVTQGNGFGAVESVKATSDVNSPVSGKVVEVNEELSSSPGLVSHQRNMYKIGLTYFSIFLFGLAE